MKNVDYLHALNDACQIDLLKEIIAKREEHWSNKGSIPLAKAIDIDVQDEAAFWKSCETLIPWKKGPFKFPFGGLDAEWRSDFKWDRFKDHLPDLSQKKILDIGCNNGYYMFEMAKENPKLVLGIDPIPRCQAQFLLLNKLYQHEQLKFELLGVEHTKYFKESFDVILFMGIIYHHRHPLEQLIDIREALAPGGEMIFETIGIPGEDSVALFPEDRYAGMKNIYFIPTLSCAVNWLKKAKFINVEVISNTEMTNEEQRSTKWNPESFKTLEDTLDPNNKEKTIEGHPAPRRFLIKASKKT